MEKAKRQRVNKLASARLPTAYGIFEISVYHSGVGQEAVVLSMGEQLKEPALLRVHSQCLTGEVFQSLKCDCRAQLNRALEIIGRKGQGLIIYLSQEGRGIGLTNKIRAYGLQDQGLDTVEANEVLGFSPDERDYSLAVAILRQLGIKKVILLTNSPDKVRQLSAGGIIVAERRSLEIKPAAFSRKYLRVKKTKFGHYLKLV